MVSRPESVIVVKNDSLIRVAAESRTHNPPQTQTKKQVNSFSSNRSLTGQRIAAPAPFQTVAPTRHDSLSIRESETTQKREQVLTQQLDRINSRLFKQKEALKDQKVKVRV